MSMNHSAFVFDYAAFERELKPVLVSALSADDDLSLKAWIEANKASLVDPYEGKKLGVDWGAAFSDRTIQTYADIALTKYYDPTDSVGLDQAWQEISEDFEQTGLGDEITLGEPVGPDERRFDPGMMGSYFQSPAAVAANLEKIEQRLQRPSGSRREYLEAVQAMLERASKANKGLYVTF